MTRARPVAAVLAAAALVVACTAPPAAGTTAPAPQPPLSYVNTTRCIDNQARPPAVKDGVSWGQRALEYTAAWKLSRGADVKVAVIDTGVNPGPEFGSRLTAGADLVLAGQKRPGLDDCDGHGTLVAGLIGASPDATSGFSGVAPDADLVSIRQSSENYSHRSADGSETKGAGNLPSLAAAIRYAVGTLKVQVVNISLADCDARARNTLVDASLKRAITDAVKTAVVVSAAGNLSDSGTCATQNTPGQTPVTDASPAFYDIPGVLAVGALGQDGQPAAFSLAGPWVDVAAPGTDIVATSPLPGAGAGQVDKITTANGAGPIQGTSFAAPYVSGVVALVRARFPDLTPPQVTTLIERTAAHPSSPGGRNDFVGYGLVDPVAALSAEPADAVASSVAPAPRSAALPVQYTKPASTRPQRVALWGGLVVVAVVAALAVGWQSYRARRRRVNASAGSASRSATPAR